MTVYKKIIIGISVLAVISCYVGLYYIVTLDY